MKNCGKMDVFDWTEPDYGGKLRKNGCWWCGGVVVFLWWCLCGGVLVVWCFCGGVVVSLRIVIKHRPKFC